MKSITFRLTFWYAFAATSVAALFMFAGYFLLERSFIAGLDELNDVEFEEIRPRLERLGPHASRNEVVEAIANHAELDASLYFFQVGRNHDEVFYRSSNMRGTTLPVSIHGEPQSTAFDPELGTLRVGEYSVNGYDVHIAFSMRGLETLNAQLIRVASMLLTGVLAISVGIGYAISRLALNPIAKIERTASCIDIRNLGERIEVSNTDDEIAQLGKLLNQMLERLEAAFSQAQRFAADASHELKTPLTVLRLRTEQLLRNDSSLGPGARDEMHAQLENIEQLTRVIEDLLILSKAEVGALNLDLHERSVPDFLKDFEQDASALAEDRTISFTAHQNFDGFACFDATWLRHALFNLLSNSLKFAPAGSRIDLESSLAPKEWILVFIDEGPGVEESKLARIFERFFTLNTERRNDKGSGIGLALVKAIVVQHGGSVTAANRIDRSGLRVAIRLPRPCPNRPPR